MTKWHSLNSKKCKTGKISNKMFLKNLLEVKVVAPENWKLYTKHWVKFVRA